MNDLTAIQARYEESKKKMDDLLKNQQAMQEAQARLIQQAVDRQNRIKQTAKG
jgi:TnpA family transposase